MLHLSLGIVIGIVLMTGLGYAKRESDADPAERGVPCVETTTPSKES